MTSLIDIGANLTNSRFQHDLEETIQRAKAAGVSHCIVTGTSLRESQKAYQLTSEYDCFFSTAGVHPHDAKSWNSETQKQLEALLQNQKVVAVGECGLDFNRNFSPREQQLFAFQQQIEMAQQTGKALFLHERDAFDEMVEIIQSNVSFPKAVIHCFTGNSRQLEKYVELGCYIGITGWICDERRGHDLQKAVSSLPLERVLLETDSPYLIPRDLRPKPKDNRNEPAYLIHIAKEVAKRMNVSFEELTLHSLQNTAHLFGLSFSS